MNMRKGVHVFTGRTLKHREHCLRAKRLNRPAAALLGAFCFISHSFISQNCFAGGDGPNGTNSTNCSYPPHGIPAAAAVNMTAGLLCNLSLEGRGKAALNQTHLQRPINQTFSKKQLQRANGTKGTLTSGREYRNSLNGSKTANSSHRATNQSDATAGTGNDRNETPGKRSTHKAGFKELAGALATQNGIPAKIPMFQGDGSLLSFAKTDFSKPLELKNSTPHSRTARATAANHTYHYDDITPYPPWRDGTGLGNAAFQVDQNVSARANESFQLGLRLLHCFEYPSAIYQFRQAQEQHSRSDGVDFLMALWGEALCYNQQLWFTSQPEEGRALSASINRTIKAMQAKNIRVSEQELDLAKTVLPLFAEDEMDRYPYQHGSNMQAYHAELEKLIVKYPNNTEIGVFHALALLATRESVRDIVTMNHARCHMDDLLQTAPNHTGLHHYRLHATETSELACFAGNTPEHLIHLPSSAVHLTHMPSHHYFAVGELDKIIAVNKEAWKKSVERMVESRLGNDSLAFHVHKWLVYAFLQADQMEQALGYFGELRNIIKNSPPELRNSMLTYYTSERAFLLTDPRTPDPIRQSLWQEQIPSAGISHGAVAMNLFLDGLKAINTSDTGPGDAVRALIDLQTSSNNSQISPAARDAIDVMTHQLNALQTEKLGNKTQAIRDTLTNSKRYMAMRWDHGTPQVVMPELERLGNLLLDYGCPATAMLAFYKEEKYSPNRHKINKGLITAAERLHSREILALEQARQEVMENTNYWQYEMFRPQDREYPVCDRPDQLKVMSRGQTVWERYGEPIIKSIQDIACTECKELDTDFLHE